jgi:succinate dehydrogenase / fumarate reductase cytochrome b subunit
MSTSETRKRPEYRNIHITDLISYRLPLAGLVSILHRISGAVMFLLLPFVLWVFDTSLRSQQGWDTVAGVLSAWPLKIVALGLFWALAHHLCAGIRHVLMEARHALSKQQGRRYAAVTLTVSLLLTAAFAVHLFTGA